ncbi:hypothetical protein GGR56DRAFT_668041 [Xylariaceae sp. FL0804]|nr:hypothetical protein GGR56DRAFT_668041 [Xylariaceae sp. FL0804]
MNVTVLLTSISAATALPPGKLMATMHQLARREENYDTSCRRKIPGGSGMKYQDKLSEAFGDVSKFAETAQTGKDKDGKGFTESTAFSHYFGDGDKGKVQEMIQAILNNQQSTGAGSNLGYSITIKCGSDQDKDSCDKSTLAATSIAPGVTTMVFCDRFFSPQVRQTYTDLSSKPVSSKRGGWCQAGESFDFFQVAALTVFHEMTHLDIVGSQAGLSLRQDPASKINTHGTVDVYVEGAESDMKHYDNMEPWQAARELKRLWDAYNADNTKYKPTTPTVENADSYAAAALEFYFLSTCEWTVIEPK